MSSKGYVLVVDDDIDILEAMRIILEGGEYEVETALDGRQALVKISERRPDLVVLDVMMHHKDEGFQLSYQLRSDPDLAGIPIIMVSAVSQQSGFKFSPEQDGDFLPVDEFLEKPVKPKVLLEKVAKLLGR